MSTSGGRKLVEANLLVLNERLERTFCALEEEVNAKRILRYGVSCNHFALPDNHPHFVPFELITRAADTAAHKIGKPKSSLQVFQMPGNLLDRTALLPINLGGNGCAKFAHEHGIETVINRSLTAFDNKGSWRLAESQFPINYRKKRNELLSHLRCSLQNTNVGTTEEERKEHEGTIGAAGWLARLIDDLDSQMTAFSSVMHYQDDLMRKIIPMINSKIDGMDENTLGLIFAFFTEFEKAVRSVSGELTRQHVVENLKQHNSEYAAILEGGGSSSAEYLSYLPKRTEIDEGGKSLQKLALSWLRDHPHVTTVLLGAVRHEYVDEANEVFGELS